MPSHTSPPVITDPELDHVLRVILKREPTDPLYQCLQQNFDDLWGLLIIDKADADALTFVPHGETDEVLLTSTPKNKFFGNSLNILKQYPSYRQSIGNPLSDWTTITLDDYRDFIGIANAPTNVPPPRPTTLSPSSSPSTELTLTEFRKTIKRDPTLFPVLKNAARWDSYQREFKAVARSQNVHCITDHKFTPAPPITKELFAEIQAYVYSVFVKTLLIDDGQALVRKYPCDAQKIYAGLEDIMNNSTQAELDMDEILQYLVNSRFDDGKWKGTAKSYLTNWLEQVRLYNSNCPQEINDHTLKTFLRNAFSTTPKFDQVRIQENITYRSTGKKLTYQNYVDTLTATATEYDKLMAVRASKPRRSPRNVYAHAYEDADLTELYYDSLDTEVPSPDPDVSFDINTTVLEIQKTESRPSPRLPPATWHNVSRAGQRTWASLSSNDKASIISGLTSDHVKGSKPPPSRVVPPVNSNSRSVHQHDIDPTDLDRFHAAFHAFCMGSDNVNNDVSTAQHETQENLDDGKESLHAYMAQKAPKKPPETTTTKQPGNIHRLLSPPTTRSPHST